MLVVLPARSLAQGEIAGRVVAADSGRPPVQGVEAAIAKLGRTVLGDSSGRFRLKDLPPGEHLVMLRAIGFRSESSKVFIDRDETVSWEVALTRATGTVLAERVVEAKEPWTPTHLVEFMERRAAGVGKFLVRDQLAKAEGGLRQTGDVLATVPGANVKRGSNKAWIASTRRPLPTKCAFCPEPPRGGASTTESPGGLNRADFVAGARPACYMDVFVNGQLVFDSRQVANGLFDVNTIPPDHIEGIEVYSSPAQVPARFNRTGAECGALLIWIR
jgi:hypothetical protein